MGNLAVFIDADNFCENTALDYAMQEVGRLGRHVILKHAYGNAASLKGIEVVLGKYGIRPVSNVIAGKTTTDVALDIGAIEAVCRNPDIRVVVICSGDADFAPLALRLHELGCEVICIGLDGILFGHAESFYDKVMAIKVVGESPRLPKSPPPLAPTIQGSASTVTSPAAQASSAAVAASKRPAAAKGKGPVLAPVLVAPGVDATVKQILKTCPQLHGGEWQQLSMVVQALRAQGPLPKNAKTSAFFAKLQPHFELTPTTKPNRIRYCASTVPATRVKAQVLAGNSAAAMTMNVGALGAGPNMLSASFATDALTWAYASKRRGAVPLPPEWNALRQILMQLAIRKICVADILLAAPELLGGQWCAYSAVAGRLRDRSLILQNLSLQRILSRFPDSFEVNSHAAPQTVRYLGAALPGRSGAGR